MLNILKDASFPVFGITKTYKRIWEEDNITYIETPAGEFILDNKNLIGNTLGVRRLRLKKGKLCRLYNLIHNVEQLVKSKFTTFIDSKGYVFKYIKNTRVPLKYFLVKEVIQEDNGCVLIFKDLDNPLIVSCKNAYGIQYVGFLISSIGYIPYEYSDRRKKDTWRKI